MIINSENFIVISKINTAGAGEAYHLPKLALVALLIINIYKINCITSLN